MRTLDFIRRYPLVVLTLGVGVAVALLLVAGQEETARWLASVFALGVAAKVSVGMVKDLMRGHLGIDILAVTAIVATVAVGEYVATLIICLMLAGGQALEDFAERRAKRELTALLDRVPAIAHVFQPDGSVLDVPAGEVKEGDEVLLRPSEVLAVDGILVSASAEFDESSLTGESLPVAHAAGDPVMSGIVNGHGAVRIRATAGTEDSQYARIVALVREAAESRAPVVRLADRYAVPFTLFAYAVGGLGWFLSGDPVRFAEVLVVATPCPLLIAAPVAFMGGMSRAARHGVIVKNGGTLEQLSRVRTAAFDKTGTLTHGTPRLVDVVVPPQAGGEYDADAILRLAASAEQYSSHVLAASVMSAAQERGLDLVPALGAAEEATNGVRTRFARAVLPASARVAGGSPAFAGAGVEGELEVLVGKRRWVAENASGLEEYGLREGELAVYVAVGGVFAGVLVMSDVLRPDARKTLGRLESLGVTHRLMLTGDAVATAEHIAAKVGLTEVRAELLPQDKVAAIVDAPVRPVMMVGDGVNDAPVLAAADVGVAMGAKGSTAASESADVVIMTDDLSKAALAVEVGQRTVRVALQSIWLGIALSVGLMLVASTGVLPAVAGALAQEAVDLVAILNALRALKGPAKVRGTAR